MPGKCTRGLTCPYVHDSAKVAICTRFLKRSCPYPSSACPLSHEPNANRMPHCLHFPYCNKGADCTYSHVHVAANAKVCKDFVSLGWCESGSECKERHVWECPEFSETGTCPTRGCKLPHVIRRRGGADESGIPRQMDTEEGEKNAMPTTLVEPVNILDGSRKRSHDNISPSYEDQADSERKKLRVADGVQANDDFVTLVISDTESEEADGEDQDEDEVEGSDSSVESDELDDANIAVSAVNITQQQSAEAGSSPVHSKASDRFNRKASPEEGEESEDEQ